MIEDVGARGLKARRIRKISRLARRSDPSEKAGTPTGKDRER
jgi:hypothetical protein